jgi:oligoendopeptidase F
MSNTSAIPKRSEIELKYKWHLEDIIPDETTWDKLNKEINELLQQLTDYQGHLGDSAESMYQVMDLIDRIGQKFELVYAFAHMKRDEDSLNTKAQELFGQAQQLLTNIQAAQSFVIPELLKLDEALINEYLSVHPKLALYKHAIEDTFRQKPHVLSENEEAILAKTSQISRTAKNVYDILADADLKFPKVKDEDQVDVEITPGRFIRLLRSENRQVRKDSFEATYNTYGKLQNTMAALLDASVQKDVFYARVRQYDSALQMALDQDNIPESVYDNLLNTIHDNIQQLHRYVRLRKKALGLDELHMYDLYVQIVPNVKMSLDYQKSWELVLAGLQPLGQEYLNTLLTGKDHRWIDVYETEGKTSGAYSFGVYGVHPFVLLNHQNTLDDAFTLAHEMGHALHSFYSNKTQPYVYSDYTIFLAEIASTLNEALLVEHLLKVTKEPLKRMYIINHQLEQIRTTVFRQTMFAEFEKLTHQKVENGETLTCETLNSIYRQLNQTYYGQDIVIDDLIKLEWIRIPHFYRAFYVYKYATGFSAALALSRLILSQGESAVDKYINFLSSGSKDYSLNLLKQAGVDMTKPQPIQACMDTFSSLLDEMESLL